MQQGKCEEVVLKARLSEKEKKGKWYIRNAATFKVFIVLLILDGNSVHVAHIWRKTRFFQKNNPIFDCWFY